MAIFQTTFQRRTPIDDTQHISITIETSQTINDHTVMIHTKSSEFFICFYYVFILFIYHLGIYFKSSTGSE